VAAVLLLFLIIAWLALVLGMSIWVGLRGRRLYVLARETQTTVERQSRLEELPERIAELERRQQALNEALVRLQASIAEFSVLWARFNEVRAQVMGARSFFTTK
jgi:uncharacterized coiled-coil protein SlyX